VRSSNFSRQPTVAVDTRTTFRDLAEFHAATPMPLSGAGTIGISF
jgi:hypothetical protein